MYLEIQLGGIKLKKNEKDSKLFYGYIQQYNSEIGYQNSDNIKVYNSDYLKNYIPDTKKINYIIFEYPKSKDNNVKELLTGVEFPFIFTEVSIYNITQKVYTIYKEIDTFIYLNDVHPVDSKILKEYMDSHKDVEAFKAYLQNIIQVGKNNREQSKIKK